MNIVGYADDFTRKKLGSQQERTLVIAAANESIGKVFNAIYAQGFNIASLKHVSLSQRNAEGWLCAQRL
jgi:hypothetical protein